jgi:fimbrial chaperone protein
MRLYHILSILAFVLIAPIAQAASLSVSPIRLDVPAPGSSASLTLRNEAALPINIQIRIFKWVLKNGEDFYEQTDDVVATPPVASIPPGGSALVRIVRTANAPVVGEEPYRLIVDEIPDANRVRNSGVTVALRYAIPVFFLNGDASQAKVAWSIRTISGKRMLVATNTGDKSSRVANLRLDKTVLYAGLAGYVLGHSTRMWPLPAKASGARVLADTDSGPIDAPLAR